MRRATLRNLALCVGAASLLSACSDNPYQPVDSANPWADEYAEYGTLDKMNNWGPYNVHDPYIRKFGDTYYSYSTDAIWWAPRDTTDTVKHDFSNLPKIGNIQVRKSKDLVNWEFAGWALDSVPAEAWDYVYPISGNRTSRGIWAPAIYKEGSTYRMYYCLSTFGSRVSTIGLLESGSPEGPWEAKGLVVKTSDSTAMNAIDPTIIEDAENGKLWMIYGSFFGGIYALELSRETGLAKTEGDLGQMIAHRANWQTENMEAPEIIYNPDTRKYYLFTSYGPLFTTYNVRVCMADHPEGPYTDYLGVDPRGEVNTFPILTAPYRFDNHGGWQGMAHCTCFSDGDGNYYLASQGRPSSNPGMMDLCVRKMYFRADGWPMVSPERYAGDADTKLTEGMIYGEYEIIRIHDNYEESNHEARSDGQANELLDIEVNKSTRLELGSGNVSSFQQNTFTLALDNQQISGVKVFVGHDWENQKTTVLFSGIDNQGFAIWGKKIK
ncbi:MAG: arabinan endo-1,5-alpha-L-arabinosidase [Bacteroidales bacterium]|nr:arabinan endo-1,5-alpha-L-arabinosidase [Bacteroidales bacterium]